MPTNVRERRKNEVEESNRLIFSKIIRLELIIIEKL